MPYGELITEDHLVEAIPGNPDPRTEQVLFTGKPRDKESGLDYFGPRFLSGNMLRFNSPDQPFIDNHVDDPQSWNLYNYCRSNPINIIDPTGMEIRVDDDDMDRFDNYVNSLDVDSDAYDTYCMMEESDVVFQLNFIETKSGTGEGSLSTEDGKIIDVNMVFAGPNDTMSNNGKIAHEFEHGRQYLAGELGFVSKNGGKTWGSAFYDAMDEKKAFEAQIKVSPQDKNVPLINRMLFGGNIGLKKVASLYDLPAGEKNVDKHSLPKGKQVIAPFNKVTGSTYKKFQHRIYSVVPK